MLRSPFILVLLMLTGAGSALAQAPAVHPDIAALIRQTAGNRVLEQRVFTGDFTGDGQADAVAFIYYEGGGNAVRLRVALFQGEGGRFRFLRNADDVFGENPRQPVFRPGEFQVTTTMPRPGDPRCCPTGERRYTVRVAGAASSPAAAPQAGGGGTAAQHLPPFGEYCISGQTRILSVQPSLFAINNGGDELQLRNPRYACSAPGQCTVTGNNNQRWSIRQAGPQSVSVRGTFPGDRTPLNWTVSRC